MTYDNTNRGTMGKNQNIKDDKSPPYTGKLNVEGKEYWINAWVNTNKEDGSKFFSLRVKPKEDKSAIKQEPKTQFEDLDDDIPF